MILFVLKSGPGILLYIFMYRVGWLCCKHMFFDVCICPVEIDIWQSILMMSSHSCDGQCMWYRYNCIEYVHIYIYFYDPYCILKDSTQKMECQPPKKMNVSWVQSEIFNTQREQLSSDDWGLLPGRASNSNSVPFHRILQVLFSRSKDILMIHLMIH